MCTVTWNWILVRLVISLAIQFQLQYSTEQLQYTVTICIQLLETGHWFCSSFRRRSSQVDDLLELLVRVSIPGKLLSSSLHPPVGWRRLRETSRRFRWKLDGGATTLLLRWNGSSLVSEGVHACVRACVRPSLNENSHFLYAETVRHVTFNAQPPSDSHKQKDQYTLWFA